MSPGPLVGVTVVSLAINLPGPLAASRLVELGATVVKVEPPSGDPLAAILPEWYASLAEGQRLLTLDLKDAAARAELEDLLAGADLLLTSLRPSANARLGLPESAQRHALAYVEIVGSLTDPEQAGHDLTYQAAFGSVIPPALPTLPVADLVGAERAVTAALAMLRAREHGRPCSARVALEDAAQWACAALQLTGSGGVLSGTLPNYNLYRTADGWLAVGALEPHFAARLRELVGADEELAAVLATRSSTEWEEFGTAHDIPLVAVRSPGR